MSVDEGLLAKVAGELAKGAGPGGSILKVSAASYGVLPDDGDDELTQPTGFDPQAAALFEAVVEAAFLVASADGQFDDVERDAFHRVVHAACADKVGREQLEALVADLHEMLDEDGLERRIGMVAKTVQKPEQAREVLRLAALVAYVSGGVADVERNVLVQLTGALGLEGSALDSALGEVEGALAG